MGSLIENKSLAYTFRHLGPVVAAPSGRSVHIATQPGYCVPSPLLPALRGIKVIGKHIPAFGIHPSPIWIGNTGIDSAKPALGKYPIVENLINGQLGIFLFVEITLT